MQTSSVHKFHIEQTHSETEQSEILINEWKEMRKPVNSSGTRKLRLIATENTLDLKISM